jgi:GGDEF domain-containing protein
MTKSTQTLDVDNRKKGKNIAMLTLDVRVLNDALSPPKSRELLKHIEQSIRRRLRNGDSIAQIGDDSFIVLVDSIQTLNNAQKVADSLIENLSNLLALTQSSSEQVGVNIHVDFVLRDDCEQ